MDFWKDTAEFRMMPVTEPDPAAPCAKAILSHKDDIINAGMTATVDIFLDWTENAPHSLEEDADLVDTLQRLHVIKEQDIMRFSPETFSICAELTECIQKQD